MLLFWYPKVLKCRFSSRSYSNARLVVVEFYRSLGDTDLHNCGHTTGGAISKYQHAVFDLLDHAKEEADTFHPDSLIDLQNKIERLTYPYDDMKSIYQVAPQIIRLLIKNEEDSAMEFLKKSPKLTPEELIILNGLRRYTLEGIIVHVFGLLFNSIEESPAVRLSTLVDHLDRTVRTQARLMFERGKRGGAVCLAEPPVDDKTRHIGILLVEFLLERNLISITNDLSISSQKIEIKNKEGKYYKKRASYVFCNFDTGILPIQLNLPMVCPPKDWGVVNSTGEKPTSISDLSGGYLCEPFGDMYFYNRHNLLAARDKDKFNIILNDNYEDMCHTMNALQKESFEINVDMLNYLKDNYRELVKEGLLMPTVLASINIPVAIKRLRSVYLLYNKYAEGESVSYPSVLKEFLSDVQRARYEKFLIDIASAYAGYEFYLPAYVDFRGRIYRSGVLHFHERDIARSLIVFSKRTVNEGMKKNPNAGLNTAEFMYAAATAFHYQKYPTYEDAVRAFWDISAIKKDSDLIELATRAKEPFQLLSKVVTLREESSKVSPSQLPITQDASASAYQIISYLMLDFELAKYTNIIPAKAKDKQNYCINDVYTFFLEELTKYFKGADQRKNIKDCDFISSQVCPRIDRNLAKLIGAGAATIALAGAAVGIGNVFSSTQPTFSSYSATSAIFSLLFYSFFYFAIYLKMRGIDRALADLYAWQKREEESIDFFLQLGFLLSLFFSFIYIYPWVFTYIERDNLINPLQVVVQLSCFFFNFKWRGDEIRKKHLTLLCFLGGVISTLLLKEIHFGFLPLFLSGLCFYTYLFHRQYFLTAGLLFYTLHPGLARWGFFLLFQQLVYYNLSKLLEKDQPILKRGVVYSYISLLVLFSFLGFPTIFYFLKEPARLAALVSGASIVFLCTKPGLDPLSITFLWILYFFASGILGFICSEEGFDGLIIFFLLHFQFLCGIAIFKKSLPRERQSIVPLFFGFFFYFVPYFPHLEWLETWAEGFDLLLFFLSLFLFIEESQARKIEDITAGTGKASG